MNKLILLSLFACMGCATKTVCLNSNESFRSVLDSTKGCSIRIREVLIGSDADIPKSISFKDSDTGWGYRWVEGVYRDGVFELRHFVLVPLEKDSN